MAAVGTVVRKLWLPYLLATFLILCGFRWSWPSAYQGESFQADENAAIHSVYEIHSPDFNPKWFGWGTGLFYQAYAVKTALVATHLYALRYRQLLVIGRLIVFASALGAITALFFLGRKLFDERTGWLAAIILAVLPAFVINGHYFKTDIPATFWIMLTLLVACHLIESGNPRFIPILGFLAGYSASMKYNASVVFVSGCVAIILASRGFRKGYSWIYYFGSVLGGFLFGEPHFLFHFQDVLNDIQWVGSLNRIGAPYWVARLPGWMDYPLNVMPYSMTTPFLLIAAVALIWILATHLLKCLPLLVFILGYFSFFAIDNARLVRYTVPLLPIAALFVASFLIQAKQWRLTKFIVTPLLPVLLAYIFVFSFSYVRTFAATDPRIAASQWIEQHLPAGQAIPSVLTGRWNVPQYERIGYKKLEIAYSIPDLNRAESPYLVVSQYSTFAYDQAAKYYPKQEAFLTYVAQHYTQVAKFENSQKLLGIDSKAGSKLPLDWLHPNPKITILVRRDDADRGD